MSHTTRTRTWCFTLNNYNDVHIKHIKEVLALHARYVVFGKEVGKQGTPHLQGYVYFTNAKQRQAVARLLPNAWLDVANGSAEKNRKYCTKEGDFWEQGEIPMEASVARAKGGAGNAARYATAIELAKNGNIGAIERDDPQLYLLHGPRLESLYAPNHGPMDGELLHEWWVGPTGAGKSRLLWELYPNHFPKPLNKWWDGYRHEEVVAIEEWAPKNDCTASALKRWADRFPFTGEIKGGVKQRLRPKKIIVLSNYTIQQCFLNSEDMDPILRRFTVMYFPKEEPHARFRAAAMKEPEEMEIEEDGDEDEPPEQPLEFSLDEDLPDLDLDGDFFTDL